MDDTTRDNICAVHILRKADLLIEPVRAHVDKITSVISSGAAKVDPEAWYNLNDEITGVWEQDGARQN